MLPLYAIGKSETAGILTGLSFYMTPIDVHIGIT